MDNGLYRQILHTGINSFIAFETACKCKEDNTLCEGLLLPWSLQWWHMWLWYFVCILHFTLFHVVECTSVHTLFVVSKTIKVRWMTHDSDADTLKGFFRPKFCNVQRLMSPLLLRLQCFGSSVFHYMYCFHTRVQKAYALLIRTLQ